MEGAPISTSTLSDSTCLNCCRIAETNLPSSPVLLSSEKNAAFSCQKIGARAAKNAAFYVGIWSWRQKNITTLQLRRNHYWFATRTLPFKRYGRVSSLRIFRGVLFGRQWKTDLFVTSVDP